MLCTSSRLRCGFELFGRKKRISYFFIKSFTILFLIRSKNTHEVFAEVFLIKTISNPIMHIKFGKVIPIRDSSLIPLPAKIAKSDQSINIRGHSDHNCFLLFYTAAYHLTYKLGLFVGRSVDPKLEETDPHTYTKPGTHQSSGDFIMPIRLNKIPQIERFRNFQLKVSQYQKGDLIPTIDSTFEISDIFIVDLLLLYEPGRHHFVLINDLLQFVCEVRKQKFRSFLQLCRNCFQIPYNEIDRK